MWLARMPPTVDAQQCFGFEVVRGFLERLAPNRIKQGFPLLQMPGRLVELDAVIGVLFHQQELAVLLNDGSDDDMGFPDCLAHAVHFSRSSTWLSRYRVSGQKSSSCGHVTVP